MFQQIKVYSKKKKKKKKKRRNKWINKKKKNKKAVFFGFTKTVWLMNCGGRRIEGSGKKNRGHLNCLHWCQQVERQLFKYLWQKRDVEEY